MLDLEFAQFTDPGKVREHNEDYLGWSSPQTPEQARTHGWLFALADGVGGQDHGEVASRLAVESLLAGFQSALSSESLTALLPRLIRSANAQVYEAGAGSGASKSRMATTLVACALRFDRAVISHVGDSRCYLIRKGYAVPLTRDHTVSSEQLRLGIITAREAAEAQTTNLLSRSLGNDMFINVETSEHQIFTGDVLVLCSDGLHRSVAGDDLVQTGQNGANLSSMAHNLVSLARERDGSDNISVQLVRIKSVERVGMYRGRHYRIQSG